MPYDLEVTDDSARWGEEFPTLLPEATADGWYGGKGVNLSQLDFTP